MKIQAPRKNDSQPSQAAASGGATTVSPPRQEGDTTSTGTHGDPTRNDQAGQLQRYYRTVPTEQAEEGEATEEAERKA